MGQLVWVEIWLIANALLLVWRILVTTDEMSIRIGSYDYSALVKRTSAGTN
jgi:hypothetical protein